MPPNYNASIRMALAPGQPAPTITEAQHETVLRLATLMTPWALENLHDEDVAEGEPIHGQLLRVTPIEQGAAVKAHLDGSLTVTAPDGTVTRGGPGRATLIHSAAVRHAIAARSGAGLAWFQSPQQPPAQRGQPVVLPHMSDLTADVFDTYPEKYIIRREVITGEDGVTNGAGASTAANTAGTAGPAVAYWACIPCAPFMPRPSCSHCSATPSQALRPPRPLCEYHEHFARTGLCLSLIEQVIIEQVQAEAPSPSGRWTPAQKTCFVNLWRRRVASLRLFDNSEHLPGLTAAESRSVGALLGAVGQPAPPAAPAGSHLTLAQQLTLSLDELNLSSIRLEDLVLSDEESE